MVPTGRGMSGSAKRYAASHFLRDKTEKEFFNKAEGCSEMVKPHSPLWTGLYKEETVCLGNCPG